MDKMETIKLREEIREAFKEEGFQGGELEEEVDEVFNQELLRQERIRKYEERIKEYEEIERERIRQYDERERVRQHKLANNLIQNAALPTQVATSEER